MSPDDILEREKSIAGSSFATYHLVGRDIAASPYSLAKKEKLGFGRMQEDWKRYMEFIKQ